MRIRFHSFWFLALLLLAVGCKREEEVIVPDNEAPPDSTIQNVVLESYINRSYIILLGEQPDDAQMAQGKATLRTHNVSQADREAFLNGVMAQPGYHQRLFDVGRGLYLNGADTSAMQDEIFLIDLILGDSAFIAFWDDAQAQKDQLLLLMDVPGDLTAGTIDMREAHKRMVLNKIYDQINMGTQNFVISMFQNFLERYPTEAERNASETMVDGFPSVVFMQSGRTKENFVDIFIASRDYDEGQVRDLFRRYLYREPDTQEMDELTNTYRADHNYKALQIAVMSLDEFVGI